MFDSSFIDLHSADQNAKDHEQRLAFALDIDPSKRVLPISQTPSLMANEAFIPERWKWSHSEWTQHNAATAVSKSKLSVLRSEKVVPAIAFRVLDAPRLKDDYYCSVLAYCRYFRTLAVALTHRVYLWTERHGVRYPPLAPAQQTNYVTCLAFSSDEGRKGILATSRSSGHVTLWSLLEKRARFELPHPSAACSLAFKPTVTKRISQTTGQVVDCEDLLVGDDAGRIYYYSIDWAAYGRGSVVLLTKIEAHSQNVCGLSWAAHGKCFVSGGNDNCALLFHIDDIFLSQNEQVRRSSRTDQLPLVDSVQPYRKVGVTNQVSELSAALRSIRLDSSTTSDTSIASQPFSNPEIDRGRDPERLSRLPGAAPSTPPQSPPSPSHVATKNATGADSAGIRNVHRYSFYHSAAVKAIAFAPWQPTLLATGGGSNDRQIHFHHTESGTTLAVINVFAQVTSLIWSLTRREIVATFGYAQPEHEVRIAVFAWPSCECVVSIPWERKSNGEIGRALWAIPYPGGPNDAAPKEPEQAGDTHESWGTLRAGDLQTPDTRRTTHEPGMPPTPRTSPRKQVDSARRTKVSKLACGEGEIWASRTEEEGSLIIACCDQTVKFFEVWAGKAKGKSCGLGSKAGVLGGSKVLEGWCEGIAIEEIGRGEDVIQ